MIKNITTVEKDSEKAILSIVEQVQNEKSSPPVLTILFVANTHDLNVISTHLEKIEGQIVACTTSGEISCSGIRENSIVCKTFYGSEFSVKSIIFDDLSEFEAKTELKSSLSNLANDIHVSEKKLGVGSKSFGILLVDGLSVKEEVLCGYLSNFLKDLPLIGGSAGDDLNFEKTYIFQNGRFVENSASLIVLTTTRKFELFKSQHFKKTDKKIIITESIPEERIVKEMNGEPAAEYYADLLGLEVKDLTPVIFSRYPVMLEIGGEFYVRSIQKVNEDNSFTFYCAIEDGLVLTLAEKESIFDTNEALFSKLNETLGEVDSCLIFECILRKLEIIDLPEEEIGRINSLFVKNNAVGFYTYGEQFGSIHINQTLTGVAFGKK